jgi:hypothetical protein
VSFASAGPPSAFSLPSKLAFRPTARRYFIWLHPILHAPSILIFERPMHRARNARKRRDPSSASTAKAGVCARAGGSCRFPCLTRRTCRFQLPMRRIVPDKKTGPPTKACESMSVVWAAEPSAPLWTWPFCLLLRWAARCGLRGAPFGILRVLSLELFADRFCAGGCPGAIHRRSMGTLRPLLCDRV